MGATLRDLEVKSTPEIICSLCQPTELKKWRREGWGSSVDMEWQWLAAEDSTQEDEEEQPGKEALLPVGVARPLALKILAETVKQVQYSFYCKALLKILFCGSISVTACK